ncbi:hypothetical protein RQP46_006755 [Phenoliferia psychrophenolica]
MPAYSFYVFDKHCTCVYFANFAPKGPRAGPSTLPNVYRPSLTPSPSSTTALPAAPDGVDESGGGGTVGAGKDESRSGLAFDEEAKLVYGIIFSLRNMVKKLAGREDDSFHSFSTSAYKLHYLYTATAYHFVLVTSPMPESLRYLLRQIYTGPFADHVVRNPMVQMDSASSGKGIDNDAFRVAVEKSLAAV